ncbi:MAG: preQ(1) synthase [Clostridiales bacterium]|jgi:7-cyano-7-deazaguanine reductase|nr:preQ(1) synthase [Clostridiales bacterium]
MSKNKSSEQQTHELKLLGGKAQYPTKYAPEMLEVFDNIHPNRDYFVKFIAPEFTSLCPITHQPDFAKIIIRYIPDKFIVESKSLKLYLFSYRNHGDFHENCVNTIMNDIISIAQPRYIEVIGEFMPRGGIAIHPYANYGNNEWQEFARQRLMKFE